MRSAVGNSLLLNLVIVFVGIVILFFVGIISYSKAYRVKNRIVEIIEKYEDYPGTNIGSGPEVSTEINESLKKMGYSVVRSTNCNDQRVRNHIINITGNTYKNLNTENYNYCVYEIGNKLSRGGKYYIVVTFVHFDFPVIGNLINIPVYGETKVLGIDYDY